MIVYGICVGSDERYEQLAAPGLRRIGARLLERREQSSIFAAYNSILDETRSMPEASALVLLHEDVAVGPALPRQVERAVARPDVAVAGTVGARHPASLAWWAAGRKFGHVVHRGETLEWSRGCEDVHTVDGLLLVLAPWAIDELRFDDVTFEGFHGYAADLCFQALERGRRVIVDDFDVVHHTKPTLAEAADRVAFLRADLLWRRKWSDHFAYGGRRWDTIPGLWQLMYATVPARVPLMTVQAKLRHELSRLRGDRPRPGGRRPSRAGSPPAAGGPGCGTPRG